MLYWFKKLLQSNQSQKFIVGEEVGREETVTFIGIVIQTISQEKIIMSVIRLTMKEMKIV